METLPKCTENPMHEVKSINFESGMLQPILKQKGEGCVRWQKWASGGGERVESSLIKISSGNVSKRKKITKFVTITRR